MSILNVAAFVEQNVEAGDPRFYTNEFLNDNDLQLEMFDYLTGFDAEVLKEGTLSRSQELEKVCDFLLNVYRAPIAPTAFSAKGETVGKRLAIQYVPNVISLYFSLCLGLGRKTFSYLESFLLALYNLEAVDHKGRPYNASSDPNAARIPSLTGTPSIFHNNAKLYDEGDVSLASFLEDGVIIKGDVFNQEIKINSSNRYRILQRLLISGNRYITEMNDSTLRGYSSTLLRLLTRGFVNDELGRKERRIPLSEDILIEFAVTAQIIIHRASMVTLGQLILDYTRFRAILGGFAKALLVCKAISHLYRILRSKAYQSKGLEMKDNLITNASFKARNMEADEELDKGDRDQAYIDDAIVKNPELVGLLKQAKKDIKKEQGLRAGNLEEKEGLKEKIKKLKDAAPNKSNVDRKSAATNAIDENDVTSE